MITIMGIKARNMGLNIDGTNAEIEKIMASNPRKIAQIFKLDRKQQIRTSNNCEMLIWKEKHTPKIFQSVSSLLGKMDGTVLEAGNDIDKAQLQIDFD